MIFEELSKTTKDMQDLQRKISIQKNQDEQNATDSKFRMLLVQLDKTIDAIEYLHSNMNVNSDDEILASTVSILTTLEKSIENDVAEKEKVDSADKSYKSLQTELKKTWPKEFFVSMLVRDILLKQAIIELIDNSLDGARKIRKESQFSGLNINVNFDGEKFEIIDNCGGIPIDIAEEYAFRFGRPSNIESVGGETTGIFGIGMKRALFKMGNNIVIKSITKNSDFQVTIDVEKWLSPENKEWDFSFDYYNEDVGHSEDEVGTTIIVTKLYKQIGIELSDPDFEKELIEHVERRVGLDIENGIEITINKKAMHGNNVRMISSDEMSPVKESYVDPSGVKVDIIAGIAPKEGNNKHFSST
ncbi:MAG: ATP-binding protein [Lachnospira eligens]